MNATDFNEEVMRKNRAIADSLRENDMIRKNDQKSITPEIPAFLKKAPDSNLNQFADLLTASAFERGEIKERLRIVDLIDVIDLSDVDRQRIKRAILGVE